MDLGCGSGSLLEVLLKEPNRLEHIVGIDTSRKALVRAAKVIDSILFTVIRTTSQGSLHLSAMEYISPKLFMVAMLRGLYHDQDCAL